MSKKLKIKFWKSECALAMQVIEQEGLPGNRLKGTVFVYDHPFMDKSNLYIGLRGFDGNLDFYVPSEIFPSNQERDEYLDKATKAITDELFTGTDKLEVGEICKVSDCEKEDGAPNELIAILPKEYKKRFIVKVFYDKGWEAFEYARPLCKRTEPKVEENGEIITYTWEEE